jgi:hypothetical protein
MEKKVENNITHKIAQNIVISIILAVYYGAVYFGVIVPGLLEILISAYLLAVVIQNVFDKGEKDNDTK